MPLWKCQNEFSSTNLVQTRPLLKVLPPYEKIEFQNNTCFVDAALPQDVRVLVTIESNLFEEAGMIQVCLPKFFVQKFAKI